MSAVKLAVAAMFFASLTLVSPRADAQIFDTGEGTCRKCGHSELDTQRYVNSFLNQLFFYPDALQQAAARTAIAAALYGLTATFDMQGNLSPDPDFANVTIAITAEVKNALPTGNYKLTVTTPGGQSWSKLYAIGNTKFDVSYPYADGARTESGGGGSGGGSTSGSGGYTPTGGGGSTRCRREDRGNETIIWCTRP